jgi:hypothetical protein
MGSHKYPPILPEAFLEAAERHSSLDSLHQALAPYMPKATFKSRLLNSGVREEVMGQLRQNAAGLGGDKSLHTSPLPVEASVQAPARGSYQSAANPDVTTSEGRKEPPVPEVVGTGPRVEPDIGRIRESHRQRFRAKAARARQKEHQAVRFPHGPTCIFFVGDTHFGAAGSDVDRAFEEQEAILSVPGAYAWFQGDLVDNYIVGKLIAENWKPGLPVWESWELGQHYLERFGERLVAVTSGNHDQWTTRMSGIDYAREVCPDGVLYDSDQVRASVRVGNREFRVWSRHQFRGNSMYNPSHGMERAARFDSARFDVYAMGHVHRGAMSREFNLDGERKVALLSGTYKAHDDYGRAMGFPGTDASTAVGLVLEDDGSFWGTASIGSIRNYMRACYRR